MPVTNIPPVLISSGSLDATFGGDGLASTAIGAGSEQARGIAIQPDGRYVVAGWSDTGGGNYDFAVVRFNADGSLDTSFSGDGKQTTSIAAGTSADQAYGVAIQTDGKIVVAGSTNSGTNDDFAIARYNTNGDLDTSFSGDGIQTTSLSASNDGATAIAIQPDGKILAAGSSDFSFAIARYDSTGVLDTTFDADGMFTGSFGSNTAVANAMALQSDGKIIIAGYGYSGTSWDFGVARLTAAGAFDSTFSGDGKAFFHFNSTSSLVEEFKAIAIQSDGKILLAGRTVGTVGGDTFDAILMRLDTSGNLDASFGGGDGMVTLNLSNWDEFDSVVVQADGKILAAGSVQTGFGEGLTARFNADGTLDTSFSGDGVFSTTFGSGTSAIYGLAMAPDGQVVAAGDSYTGTYDFGMLRLATGVPDQSAVAGSAFSYTIPADAFFDADGNPLTYTATLANDAALPAWLSFNAATRTFSGTAAVGDFGTGEVKVTASDGLASVSANFQLEVTTDFIEALRDTSHARWNDASPNGTPGTSLTFSFMDTAPSYGTATETSTFAPMTAAEKQAVCDVLQLYHEIAGVSFTEVADAGFGGQLRFGTYLQTGTTVAAYAYSPNPAQSGGDLWVNRDTVGYDTPVPGDYSFMTLIHEVGHTLGLKHPGPYGGGEPPYLATGVDNTQYTVMSYNTRADTLYRDVTGTTSGDIHFIDVSESTQMLYDMAAIQFIYGVNTLTRSGNDTYTFDPSIPFFKTLWDGGGTDTVSVSNFTESCFIDLRDGNYSSIRMVSDPLPTGFSGGAQPTYFGTDNLAIAFGCVIENAIGGSGNDLLTGNDASNSLDGGVGNDTLTGAGGSDVFAFAVSGNGIDTITDFTLGDSITVAGAAFTGAVTAGDGSAVMASQIQLAAAGGTTTLYIGTDSTAGADVQIQLTGTFSANALSLNGNQILIHSAPPPTTSRYTLLGTGANLMDLYLPYGNLTLDGQNIVFKGNSGIDSVYVGSANGLLFDFTQAGLGVDQIYLSGNWADYTRSYSGSVVTLIRTNGGSETIKTISGDSLIFADGTVSVLSALNFLKGTAAEPVPTGATSTAFPMTASTTLNNTVRAVVQDASGETIALSRPGVAMIAKGGSGVDVVYVTAGANLDGTQLGLAQDKLYLTGNWADYSGTYAGSVVTLTRPVGTDTETVKFLGGSTSAYDSIVFADGTANSIDVLNYVKATAATPTLNTTEVTPLGTGDIVTGTTAANTLNGTATGDVIYGGGGADIINGAAGNDTIVISDTGTTASSSATIVFTSTANGTDTLIGFSAATVANGGDVLDFTAIANLTDAVATGQTLMTDFTANNVFIFDGTPITIAEAANAIATDVSVLATNGYIVLADSANHNAVTVYHSADLAGNTGVETALVILSGVNITQLTTGNFLV